MGTLDTAQVQWLKRLGELVGASASAGASAAITALSSDTASADDEAVPIVQIDPDNVTIVVGTTHRFSATIELGTETRRLSKSEAEWTSSDPAVSVDADGEATAHSLPKAPVRITAKDIQTGFSGSATATIVAPAAKTAPVPTPELQFITISEHPSVGFGQPTTSPLSSAMNLHSTRQLHATGVYAGLAVDMTKTAIWTAEPHSVATIDKNALVTAVGVGSATITATDPDRRKISNQIHLVVPEPVLQSLELQAFTGENYRGSGGATLYRDAQFVFKATGLFSNGRPKDVTGLVEWSTSNAKRGKIDKKGVFTAGMEAGAVTVTAKYGKSGPSASQDVMVLTAVNPKTRITAENFPPPTAAPDAREAAKGGSKDKPKDGGAAGGSDAGQSGRSKKDVPPYGVLTYWTHEGKSLLPLVDQALPLLDQARGLYQKLGEQLRRQNEAEKRIEKAAKAIKDLQKDISGNVSQRAKDLAEIAEAQKNHVSSTVSTLNSLRSDLWIAQRAMKNSARALEAAAKNEKAAGLRERAEKQEKLLDALLPLLGAAIEGTVNVLETGGTGAIKPAYDALAALFKYVHENPLLTEAEALEKDAKEILKEVGAEDLSIATDRVQSITAHLADIEKNAKEYLDDYVRTRHDAEEEFDRNPKSTFRFRDYAQAIEMTDQTLLLATSVVDMGMKAEHAADRVSGWFRQREDNSPADRANAPIHTQMSRDARGWWEIGATIRSQAGELRSKLQASRAAANNTFVETKRKPAGAG